MDHSRSVGSTSKPGLEHEEQIMYRINIGHSTCDSTNFDVRRRVSFSDELTTTVHEIPRLEIEEIGTLFYNNHDFARFQLNEQRRYDKMMMKRIQELVQEAMKEQLEAAYARNASPEEVDAMMPQTTEEIFELLGGMPALDIPKPLPVASTVLQGEQFSSTEGEANSSHLDTASSTEIKETPNYDDEKEENTTESVKTKKDCPQNQMEDFSDDALYDLLGVTNDLGETAQDLSATDVESSAEQNIDTPSEGERIEQNVDEEQTPPRLKSTKFHRPEHWADMSDEDLLMLGMEDDNGDTTLQFQQNDNTNKHQDHQDERTSEKEELNDTAVINQNKFHLGKASLFDKIEKNEGINEILGTSFSSDVHVENLIPLSPNSPRRSPVRPTLLSTSIKASLDLDKELIV